MELQVLAVERGHGGQLTASLCIVASGRAGAAAARQGEPDQGWRQEHAGIDYSAHGGLVVSGRGHCGAEAIGLAPRASLDE
jgi:hypothetical protein